MAVHIFGTLLRIRPLVSQHVTDVGRKQKATRPAPVVRGQAYMTSTGSYPNTEIGKKAGLFAKLQPGRARKRINAT